MLKGPFILNVSINTASTRCDDASDSSHIDYNEIDPAWVATPFEQFYHFQSEKCHERHHSIDTILMQILSVNGPLPENIVIYLRILFMYNEVCEQLLL